MKKNKKKDNILIKRKIVEEMKKFGIKRVNASSLKFLDEYILNELKRLFRNLKEELVVKGKKTLNKEDIEMVLQTMKEEEGFEI